MYKYHHDESFQLDVAIDALMANGDDESFESIATEVIAEANFDEAPYRQKGRAILQAWLDEDVSALCTALTGWTLEDLLKRADVIEDYDHTLSGEA